MGLSGNGLAGDRGERVLLFNGLMGICHRMGSHFHDWIDCKLSGFWEEKWLVGFKNGNIRRI